VEQWLSIGGDNRPQPYCLRTRWYLPLVDAVLNFSVDDLEAIDIEKHFCFKTRKSKARRMKRSTSIRRKAAAAASASLASSAAPAPKRTTSTTRKRTKKQIEEKELPHGLHVSAEVGGRPYMEDAYGHHVTDKALVFGVFDGHGGDVCSNYCAVRVCEEIGAHDALHQSPRKALNEVFSKIDREFCDAEGHSGAGSTATVGILRHCSVAEDFKLHMGFVGDSSAIVIRPDGTYEMLTSNHHGSREDERKRIEKLGGTVTYDKDDDVYRVSGVLAVTRALGDAYLKPYVSSTPETKEITVSPKDVIVVASDGLWDEVHPEDVVRTIRQHGVDAGVKKLVDAAAKVGEDNVCALAVDVGKAVATLFPDKAVEQKQT